MAIDRAKKSGNRRSLEKKSSITTILLAILVSILYVLNGGLPDSSTQEVTGEMRIHMIDVGNADAILIEQGENTMLIDAGTPGVADDIIEYISSLGITKLDVVVGTHPHNDHMGGMAKVLENIEVDTVYVPDILDMKSLQSKLWYNNFIDVINEIDDRRNEGVKEENQESIWHFPKDQNGDFVSFYLGEAFVQFMGPSEDEYSNENNYSIVMRVSYGDVDVLLSGDAEALAEKEVLATGYELNSEIYKVGHHGSDTSSSETFVQMIDPDYALISCGYGNSFDHPCKETMELLEKEGVKVYRTDESGTVVVTTDGKNIEFNTEEDSYLSGPELIKQKEN